MSSSDSDAEDDMEPSQSRQMNEPEPEHVTEQEDTTEGVDEPLPHKQKLKRDDEIEFLKGEIANVNKNFARLQELMERSAYGTTEVERCDSYRTAQGNKNSNDTDSVITIYRDAIQQKCDSSSSDDLINTSDEVEPVLPFTPCNKRNNARDQNVVTQLQDKFSAVVNNVTGKSDYDDGRGQHGSRECERDRDVDGDRRSSDRDSRDRGPTPQQQARQHAEGLIREAEASKARIMEVPGNPQPKISLDFQFIHSALVDVDYQLVAAHVDEVTRRKIENCEFVEFSKLLPKHKGNIQGEEDNRMQMVNHNGRAYYVPASDLERAEINSLFRWEQAFRVFSDIFIRKFPNKPSELIQYNHIIHTAALSAPWDNVAAYDREFRRHIARHLLRSWGIILQQAWTFHIKDKSSSQTRGNEQRNEWGTPGRKKELCWRFNRGKCSYGMNCKFDHKCGACGKFGHGAHSCHKLGHNSDRYYSSGGQDHNDNDGKPKQGDRFHFYASDKRSPAKGRRRDKN